MIAAASRQQRQMQKRMPTTLPVDLDRPESSLAPTALGAAARPKRHWRTRVDPFATVWPTIAIWLEANPTRTARQQLQRLRDEGLGEFPAHQLRTLQRRIQAWRRAQQSMVHSHGPSESI
jgi:hypothetical protein